MPQIPATWQWHGALGFTKCFWSFILRNMRGRLQSSLTETHPIICVSLGFPLGHWSQDLALHVTSTEWVLFSTICLLILLVTVAIQMWTIPPKVHEVKAVLYAEWGAVVPLKSNWIMRLHPQQRMELQWNKFQSFVITASYVLLRTHEVGWVAFSTMGISHDSSLVHRSKGIWVKRPCTSTSKTMSNICFIFFYFSCWWKAD